MINLVKKQSAKKGHTDNQFLILLATTVILLAITIGILLTSHA
jgi:hypothetical protein